MGSHVLNCKFYNYYCKTEELIRISQWPKTQPSPCSGQFLRFISIPCSGVLGFPNPVSKAMFTV